MCGGWGHPSRPGHGTGAGKPQGLPSQSGLEGQQTEVSSLEDPAQSSEFPTGHLLPPADSLPSQSLISESQGQPVPKNQKFLCLL